MVSFICSSAIKSECQTIAHLRWSVREAASPGRERQRMRRHYWTDCAQSGEMSVSLVGGKKIFGGYEVETSNEAQYS